MLEQLADMPDGVVGFEGVGQVEAEDYRTVMVPVVTQALSAGGKLRMVYLLGDRFEGFTAGAEWQDTKLGLEHFTRWERCAIVSDLDWVRHLVHGFGWLMPGTFEVFPTAERDQAIAWAAT